MPRVERFDLEFVGQIPDGLSEGTLYMSMQFGMAIHLCACGCGNQTVTPLDPADYKLIYDGETVTLHPSVGNWNFPCESHYLICRSKVIWVDEWTKDQRAAFRGRDRYLEDHPSCGPQTDAGDTGDTAVDRQEPIEEHSAASPVTGGRRLLRRLASHLWRRR